ncbi:MAG: hypothetical protein ACXU82_03705 [Caulobacteraceae bacterium]
MAKHLVPDEALEADIVTIAQKGAGKTYANRGLVERLLAKSRRVVVMDPLNAWWGLKARADGKPGFPIAVIGGPNADVPLDPTTGEALGAFIAGSDMSVVIDVSELRRGELIRFSIDFLAALYRLNRAPLWLVLEEADVFAPQQPMGDQTLLLHHVDQIARRGRAMGFRLWTITQRPAKLHKDVLTQTSTLIMLRLRSPQDRAAAEEWIKGNAESAQAKEIVASLASLPVGDGWVWAPDHQLLERGTFPPIKTLDTSATPRHGDAAAAAGHRGKLALADVSALRAALSTPAQVVGDPKLTGGSPPIDQAAIDAARAEGFAAGRTEGIVIGSREAVVHGTFLLEQAIAKLRDFGRALEHPDRIGPPGETPSEAATRVRRVGADLGLTKPQPAKSPPLAAPGPPSGNAGAEKLLQAIRGAPRAVYFNEVAILACMSPTAGYTRAARKALRDTGKVVEGPDGFRLAPGEAPHGLPEAAALVDAWAGKLGGAAARILRHLFVMAPQTADQVARGIELSPTAGYTRAGWKALRANNLIRETASGWELAEILQELPR